MRKLFQLCQMLLLTLGGKTKLSYVEISVVFNLWIQGGLLLLSSFAPITVLLCTGNYRCHVSGTVLLTVYATMNTVLYTLMLVHYRLPFDRAFHLCVDDLQRISSKLRVSYQAVNILIFVVLFLLLITINAVLASCMAKI